MPYITLLLAILLTACGNTTGSIPTIKPYKMDIQQGNVVTPKMMMQLRPGMSKSQVRFIMGTPLLTDSFHGDRWDYFYQMRKSGAIIEQRRVILEFNGDELAHVRGDVIPAGSDASAAMATSKAPKSVTKVPKEKDKGWLDKLKFWGDEDKSEKPAEKPATVPAELAKPEPAPAAPAPKPVAKQPEAPKPAPVQAPEEQAPPVAEEPAKPAPAPTAEPMPQAEPAKAEPQPAEKEKKGWLNKLKFWGDDDKVEKPVEKPAPAPVAAPKPAPMPEPAAKPEPKPEPAPVAKPQPKAEPAKTPDAPAPSSKRGLGSDAASRPAPKPPAELPPEDSPDFFEKMLEKIGF